MKSLISVILFLLLSVTHSFAGSCVRTALDFPTTIDLYTCTIVASGAGGSYTATTESIPYFGLITDMETNPGSPAPTAGYGIQMLDSQGGDMLRKALDGTAATSATETQFWQPAAETGGTTKAEVYIYETEFTLDLIDNSVDGASVVYRFLVKRLPIQK